MVKGTPVVGAKGIIIITTAGRPEQSMQPSKIRGICSNTVCNFLMSFLPVGQNAHLATSFIYKIKMSCHVIDPQRISNR